MLVLVLVLPASHGVFAHHKHEYEYEDEPVGARAAPDLAPDKLGDFSHLETATQPVKP